MHNKSIEKRINNMRLEKLQAIEDENEKKKINEDIRNKKNEKFNDSFWFIFEFMNDCRNKKGSLIELLTYNKSHINDTKQMMSSYNGITINVIPNNMEIISSSVKSNDIFIGIRFEPYSNSELIEDISWFIDNRKLCSYMIKNTKPTDNDKFYIPKNVFLGFPITSKKSEVKSVISPFNYYNFYYIIKINYNEVNNEYSFKSIHDCILSLNDIKHCCVNIYGTKLDCSINKNVLLENLVDIKKDLNNILTKNINENKFLKYEEKKLSKTVFRPFDLDEEYWNERCYILGKSFITDYPRYFAQHIQHVVNIKKLNKKWFKYIC